MVHLKVQLSEHTVLEVDALNEDELANVVNRTLNKFFKGTKYVVDVKEPF